MAKEEASTASCTKREESKENVSTVWIVKEIGGQGEKSWLDKVGELADNNLRLFRAIPWVIGGIGIILVYRNTHLLRQFQNVRTISKHIIGANTKMYGHAVSCEWDSVNVWHVSPIMRAISWRTRPPADISSENFLRVKFAGVAITSPHESRHWLERELLQRPVWFTLLAINRDQQALECVVQSKKKGFFQRRYSVNRALLSAGLGVMTECTGFKSTKAQDKFQILLRKSERRAQSRGRGVWEGSEHVVWWRRLTRPVYNMFKSK